MHTNWKSTNSFVFLTALATVAFGSVSGAPAQTISAAKERELISVLRSNATEAEKALACKGLAIDGSSAAVPELAKLLADERLASWSRIALEAIPGAASDEALRKATESLQGRLLVGVINSIGVRRDAGAAELLSSRMADKDAEVVAAAAVALGRIGNPVAAKSLRQALTASSSTTRAAAAEGCILCAERFLAVGNAGEATKLYDETRKADVPRQRMLEATRGAILARGPAGVPLLVEQLKAADKGLFQIALSTARELPGRAVDQALAMELDGTAPDRAALVISAMADRNESASLPAFMKAASRGPKPVRIAAIGAMRRVGDGTCLAPLLEIAQDSDFELSQPAKEALAALPGEAVNKEIVARLARAEGKSYPVLIELVGQRRIDANESLLKALKHSDGAIRAAALKSLGNTATDKQLHVLVAQALATDNAATAQLALKTAAVRMPDREACAAQVASAMKDATVANQAMLLDVLAAVGGTKALAAVGAAAKNPDESLQDASSRLLGEWPTIDAAPVLLDLAKTNGKYQTRALRGYIRIARQFTMTEPERVEMCQRAMEASRQPAEQKLVLDVLKRYPTLETLKLAVGAAQVPELKEDAAAAALEISKKVPKTDEVRELLSKAGLNN